MDALKIGDVICIIDHQNIQRKLFVKNINMRQDYGMEYTIFDPSVLVPIYGEVVYSESGIEELLENFVVWISNPVTELKLI